MAGPTTGPNDPMGSPSPQLRARPSRLKAWQDRARRWLDMAAKLGHTAAQIATREHVSRRTVQLGLKWARDNPSEGVASDEAVKPKKGRPPELPESWAKEFRDRPEFQTNEVAEWLASVRTRRRGRAS